MAKILPYSDRRGMTAALDIVEDALASLQEKVRNQQKRPQLIDAETNTKPLQSHGNTQTSFTSSHPESIQKKQKDTSVLIHRKPTGASQRSRGHHRQSKEETIKNPKMQKSIPESQQQQSRHKRSQQLSSKNLLSSNDTLETSSGYIERNTSQIPLIGCSDSRKGEGQEQITKNLHLASSMGAINSQRGGCMSKHSSNSSSKKRSYRNGEKSSATSSSSDESLLRKSYKLQGKLPHRSSRQSHKIIKEKKVPPRITTIHVSDSSYAQPTLTSQLRDELLSQKKEEKENLVPFIPCGSKSKSYHVGVIVQQQLGRLNNMPAKELEHLTDPLSSKQESDANETRSDCGSVTEQTIKNAMANIEQHIAMAMNHL
ncbi:uncharacterized protein LOC121855029 [Homarus americanus]|uniref:Uncharacterized protein n=1 Tax=Homarus americanus TaxID=6706 RepID=A0A8J5NA50_HOMAM|nr:uncharacterized protein LOC121855029 [Homarus americanus]KAG7175738.1 hypothetical protein Hamer_G009740 [Homarus americanus]